MRDSMDLEEMMGDEEEEGMGRVILLGVIVFFALAILSKFGIAPGEVWSFVKLLFFPATWDLQLGHVMPSIERAMMMIVSGIVTAAVIFGVMLLIDYIDSWFFSPFKAMKVFSLLFKGLYEVVMYLMIFNCLVMAARFCWHMIMAFFSWF